PGSNRGGYVHVRAGEADAADLLRRSGRVRCVMHPDFPEGKRDIMASRSYMLPLAVAALAGAAITTRAAAQQHVTVTAGEHYDVGGVLRALGGANWRDLWGTPVRVPVLNLATHAGGLEVDEAGGRQSRTLHFHGADGRRYIFRSTDKFLHG